MDPRVLETAPEKSLRFHGPVRLVCWLGLIAALLVFTLSASLSMRRKSATWDEVPNFALGRYLLASGTWNVPGCASHPPLSYFLQSLPILNAELPMEAFAYVEHEIERDPDFLGLADPGRGRKLLAAPGYGNGVLLNRARLSMIILGAVTLLLVFAWAWELYGPWGAFIAALLFGFSPNLIAHYRLLTPDPVLTTTILLSAYTMWRAFRQPRVDRILLSGIALGLALLSKHTALVLPWAFGLIAVVEVIVAACRAENRKARTALNLLGKRALIIGLSILVAFVLIVLAYRGNFSAYTNSIAFQLKHGSSGHMGYLMGRFSLSGWWYYFVFVMLFKTPIPMLLAFGLAVVTMFFRRGKSPDLASELFLLAPGALLFMLFSLKQLAMGLRYILPLFPLLMILSGRIAVLKVPKWSKALAAFLAVWLAVGTLLIYPHYLAYFNEITGGPSRGYRVLADSNLDWGQDLIGLRDFMKERGIDRINFSYFGTDDPAYYGIEYTWLPSYFLPKPSGQRTVEFPPSGWTAVSATCLVGIPPFELPPGIARQA
ncbi:ArnT family glycosyltransferase, partial [Acidobacteriota bacterium]